MPTIFELKVSINFIGAIYDRNKKKNISKSTVPFSICIRKEEEE